MRAEVEGLRPRAGRGQGRHARADGARRGMVARLGTRERAFGWDVTEVQGGPSAPGRIVDPTWVESAELAEPGEEWRGSDDLIAYLEALFDPGEVVGYVVESWDNEGRRVPSGKGRTPRRRARSSSACGSTATTWPRPSDGTTLTAARGSASNPLDGNGVRNDNVAEYRYAPRRERRHVGWPPARHHAELELPAAAIVHSGGKSVHAVVHVDAKDYDGVPQAGRPALPRRAERTGLR